MPAARSRSGATKGGMTLGMLDLPVAPMEAVGQRIHDARQEIAMTRNRPGWRALASLLSQERPAEVKLDWLLQEGVEPAAPSPLPPSRLLRPGTPPPRKR